MQIRREISRDRRDLYPRHAKIGRANAILPRVLIERTCESDFRNIDLIVRIQALGISLVAWGIQIPAVISSSQDDQDIFLLGVGKCFLQQLDLVW